MLSGVLSRVDHALLSTVCADHWPESQTLDFKDRLPGNDEKGPREFLKDVCAFANASGGDLVYGVHDTQGRAKEIVPIPAATHAIDATKRRLGQILESGIEPSLPGVVMHPVVLANGDYVLVVRVPVSFQRPHRYRHKDTMRWVVRTDTRTADLTYEQIRDAFDRGATLAERARRFRDERVTGLVSGTTGRALRSGPRCIVHPIPLASMAGRVSVDVVPLYHNGYQEFMFGDWGGATRTFNLDGLLVYPGQNTADIAYTQLFRTGELEAARWAGMLYGEGKEAETSIPSGVLSGLIRDALIKFFAAASRWNISGPAIATVSLVDAGGQNLWYQPRGSFPVRHAADRQNMILPEVWVEQVGSVEDPDLIIRPLLDTLWQSFGFERCWFYDPQGKWSLH